MKALNITAQVLLVIGALNWGLVGLFDFNLVAALFGADSILSNLVYILVGLAGLYGLYMIATLAKQTETHHRSMQPTHAEATGTRPPNQSSTRPRV